MKISVIIPTRGDGRYINDCLDSLCARTCDDIEKIVLEDDGSSPAGVAAVRNRGIVAATGDYLFFLDDDDFLSSDALCAAAEEAEKNPGALVRVPKRTTWFGLKTVMGDPEKESAPLEATDGSVTGLLIPAGLVRTASGSGGQDQREGHGEQGLEPPLFEESFRFYSDLPALARLLEKAELVNARGGVYYSRFHNDPVRYPALSQEKSAERYAEMERSYVRALKIVHDERLARSAGYAEGKQPAEECAYSPRARAYITKHICEETCSLIYDKKNTIGSMKDSDLMHVSRMIAAIPQEDRRRAIGDMKYPAKKLERMLTLLAKGRLGAVRRRASFARKMSKKKGIFGSALQWKFNISKLLFSRLSVKKELTLFESFFGKSYGDSPRAIYEYMSSAMPERTYVWAIDNKGAKIPGKHKEVKPMSFRYFYCVARCGAWISNMRQPDWYVKKEGVVFLETWHGTPLKKLVFDMDEVHGASPDYKQVFYKQSRVWDWLVSPSPFATEAFMSAFLFPREKIIEEGYPRNDMLLAPDRDERRERIRRELGIDDGRQVVLYAPTWRDDSFYEGGRYKFDLPLDIEIMRQLKDRYIFLLRTHYYIADNLQIGDEEREFVKDVSRYNDITELYLASDVLITDYSSVFFDYAILDRPILFYVYDLERYRDTLRGFYFDMEEQCPGPMLTDSRRVREALEDLAGVREKYAARYEAFRRRYCALDDGHAAERVVQKAFGMVPWGRG